MSEHDDKSAPDVPEFVAVTPRGSAREESVPAPASPQADAESAPDPGDDASPDAEPSPQDAAGEAEAVEGTAAAPDSDETGPAESGEVTAAPSAVAAPSPTSEPAPPTVSLHWTPPTLDRPVPEAPGPETPRPETPSPEAAAPGPEAETPQPGAEVDQSEPAARQTLAAEAEPSAAEPEAQADGAPAISVRAAAEGLAAALSGEATAGREDSTRSVGPVALATAVCVVLAIAAAVLLVVTARSNSRHTAIDAARVAALDAAKRETALALTYDYRTLDADFQRAEAGMSRRFRASYADTAATTVTPLAKQTHAVTTGTIAAGGVVAATPDTARVLVFANQVVQNRRLNATSRLDRSVIDVRMVKEDGRWVIDDLRPF